MKKLLNNMTKNDNMILYIGTWIVQGEGYEEDFVTVCFACKHESFD